MGGPVSPAGPDSALEVVKVPGEGTRSLIASSRDRRIFRGSRGYSCTAVFFPHRSRTGYIEELPSVIYFSDPCQMGPLRETLPIRGPVRAGMTLGRAPTDPESHYLRQVFMVIECVSTGLRLPALWICALNASPARDPAGHSLQIAVSNLQRQFHEAQKLQISP